MFQIVPIWYFTLTIIPFLSQLIKGGGSPVATHWSSYGVPNGARMISGASTMFTLALGEKKAEKNKAPLKSWTYARKTINERMAEFFSDKSLSF